MQINYREILLRLARQTTCTWTSGYIACALDIDTPVRNQVARDIIDGCGSDNKVQAIKKIRENFGLRLKEAKDLVDEYYRSGNIVGLDDDDPNANPVPF